MEPEKADNVTPGCVVAVLMASLFVMWFWMIFDNWQAQVRLERTLIRMNFQYGEGRK